tara:strand:+ start:1206 stop:2036 length:831 start_codon:yes stop_codon:yes gene_type:complete
MNKNLTAKNKRTVSPTSVLASRLRNLRQNIDMGLCTSKSISEELSMLIPLADGLDEYIENHSSVESVGMKMINVTTMSHDWDKAVHEKKTQGILVSRMMSSPVSAQFLKMLVNITKSKIILEIGLFTGYTALAMAEGTEEDGRVISCEIDPYCASFTNNLLLNCKHGEKVEIRVGNALEIMNDLRDEKFKFDFVFIDADKTEYMLYLNSLIDLNLVDESSLLCFDNVFLKGSVFSDEKYEKKSTQTVRILNTYLAGPKFFTTMIPLRDGMSLCKLK